MHIKEHSLDEIFATNPKLGEENAVESFALKARKARNAMLVLHAE